MNDSSSKAAGSATIDPQNPWLGLSSYTEESRAYFHGRDEEAAELARRVQRKLLTVLFGQSGLGKTSLLRAGLVPRLRGEGYCPVYVRVDYSPDSPAPSEQIKLAIFRATEAAGHWSRPGSAVEGESLWEFLHHRGDLLRDASGSTLLPLLIFDQFEEIFTLAQADDAGRLRAKRFLDDLADLVENRPPAELERRLEQDEAIAEDYDFARADYRILIALREDYLAHLESVKGAMPSITQNRMRLARMTGAQALSAVVNPGGRLVSREVAESIVRFVAGGAELANAEVEPSLLSLICRELNTVRLSQGRAEISADLLAGSRDSILTEFYERALADQPPGVRRVIEDELLTESGYRESLAEERVSKALAAVGASPDALATLVDRRLLRIEERLDMRRVELTHDVLCGVVRSSRDLRHEREARDEAERRLAEQKEREAQTHRTLVRTRIVAGVCAVLMLVALAGAAFGWINYRRARAADVAAQQARADAEKLVGFLIEDFYAELQPTGRVETMGKLARMAVSYYDGLPPELLTRQTQVYRGMALVRAGGAALMGDDVEGGGRNLAEARALFEKLRAQGDTSEPVALGLAWSLFGSYSAFGPSGGPMSRPTDLPEAADLLRPYVSKPESSRQTRLVYADILNHLSHSQPVETGIASCEEARGILVGIGALDLTDLGATSVYADTADSQARHALELGRLDDAARLEQEVYELAEKVLQRRPGDLRSMANRALSAGLLGQLAFRRFDYATAMDYAVKSEQAGEDYVAFDPSDANPWVYWIRGKAQVAVTLLEQGRVQDAMKELRSAMALPQDERAHPTLGASLNQMAFRLTALSARLGPRGTAERDLQEAMRAQTQFINFTPRESISRKLLPYAEGAWRARINVMNGEYAAALEEATRIAAHVRKIEIPPDDLNARDIRANFTRNVLLTAATAAIKSNRYPEGETAARELLELPPDPVAFGDPQDDSALARMLLAHSITRQDRAAEARETLRPALEHCQRAQKAGATGLTYRRDCAYALYVSSLTESDDPAGRAKHNASLSQATGLIAGMSGEAHRLRDVQDVSDLITSERGRAP
jgi:tetratricopeptide (TPR) repeat protein